jgi:hypothetical protein
MSFGALRSHCSLALSGQEIQVLVRSVLVAIGWLLPRKSVPNKIASELLAYCRHAFNPSFTGSQSHFYVLAHDCPSIFCKMSSADQNEWSFPRIIHANAFFVQFYWPVLFRENYTFITACDRAWCFVGSKTDRCKEPKMHAVLGT